ncbi:hypothetical protein ACLOJK_000946, partial [Asimina triloba]
MAGSGLWALLQLWSPALMEKTTNLLLKAAVVGKRRQMGAVMLASSLEKMGAAGSRVRPFAGRDRCWQRRRRGHCRRRRQLAGSPSSMEKRDRDQRVVPVILGGLDLPCMSSPEELVASRWPPAIDEGDGAPSLPPF